MVPEPNSSTIDGRSVTTGLAARPDADDDRDALLVGDLGTPRWPRVMPPPRLHRAAQIRAVWAVAGRTGGGHEVKCRSPDRHRDFAADRLSVVEEFARNERRFAKPARPCCACPYAQPPPSVGQCCVRRRVALRGWS